MSDIPEDDPSPSVPEVRAQLERILAGSEFAPRDKPSEVLRLVVEEHLEGRVLTEEDIRKKVYPSPPYDPEGTYVRTAMNSIRTLLDEFYESSGKSDPVHIALPVKFSKSAPRRKKRDSYPVVWSYNPGQVEVALYRMGVASKALGTPAAFRKALRAFEMVLEKNPIHCAAQLSKLECLLLMALSAPGNYAKIQILQDARAHAQSTDTTEKPDWRFFLFRGLILLFEHRRVPALQMFIAALDQKDEEFQRSLWSPVLGLLMGMAGEAVANARSIAAERPNDLNVWAALGFAQYFARAFDEAEDSFMLAIRIDQRSWLANLGLTIVGLAKGTTGVFVCYQRVRDLLFLDEPIQLGIGFLAYARSYSESTIMPTYLSRGTTALIRSDPTGRDWLQLALCYLDTDKEAAADSLIRAWRMFDPLTFLIPIWPIFDPLRGHPAFDALVREISGASLPEDPKRE